MSALVLLLAAGMVANDCPAAVSSEMEQGLGLSGEWVGTVAYSPGEVFDAEFSDNMLKQERCLCRRAIRYIPADEGAGRFRLVDDAGLVRLGIYRREGDRLTICIASAGAKRPRLFDPIDGKQELFVLHRWKVRYPYYP